MIWPVDTVEEVRTCPEVVGTASASNMDVSVMADEPSSQEVPSGLRVLPVQSVAQYSGSGGAVKAESLGEESNAFKGLAVLQMAGQHVVVCYDRARSLHVHCLEDP
jgi:hypothetical protein